MGILHFFIIVTIIVLGCICAINPEIKPEPGLIIDSKDRKNGKEK